MRESNFCAETSIHGFKYVSECDFALSRFVWIAAIIVSFTMAAFVTYGNITSWQDQPSVVAAVDTVDIAGRFRYPTLTLVSNAYVSNKACK